MSAQSQKLIDELFHGKDVTVGEPHLNHPDYDPTVQSDEPADNCTGGQVISYSEYVELYGLPGVRRKPSAWKFVDALPMYIVGAALLLVVAGLVIAFFARLVG